MTLGALRASGYQPKSVKDELRDNLIARLRHKQPVFTGIYGYEDTVIPDLQRAILSRHNLILLGLRGQAKTRIARQLTELLDEYVPVVAGSELNDDPMQPISRFARDLVAQHGDETPIYWLHRSERYAEKLATPDVTVADLIGDVDPIKAASLKLPYSDERTIHFGIIPRSHRCLFVINELPDLQPRIQVSLFNILQEGDIQIRGFKLRLPLDIQFIFTANPEDYTNRGSIVTPLKDRIESQILTHYPHSRELSRKITAQEAHLPANGVPVVVSDLCADLVETVAIEARNSEFVDHKSGVSARLTISAYENLRSAAERRALLAGETTAHTRVGDLLGIVPAITGKIELVYEGEQEGPGIVAQKLISKAIRTVFTEYFPDPEKAGKRKNNPYTTVKNWFESGQLLDLLTDMSEADYRRSLDAVPGLCELVQTAVADADAQTTYLLMEFALHGMAEYSLIGKGLLQPAAGNAPGLRFSDLLSGMLNLGDDEEEDDDFGGYYERGGGKRR